MTEQVFVVGTGRCGSTLLSSVLRLHPEVTSISELLSFATDLGSEIAATFPDGEVDGMWLWQRIASPLPRQNLMIRHDVAMHEVLYPWRDRTHRFDRDTGVPAIAQVTLPHLTDDPDGWFDALEPVVKAFEDAPVGVQLRRLFDWLAARDRGAVWVERSGGSLRVVHRLIEHFPEARFVHLVRDGRDTALSMSRHRGFKMVLACFQMLELLGCDPFQSSDRRWEGDLPDDLAALLPERFTRRAFCDFEAPPPLCGHYWSGEIVDGLAVLDRLPPERLLTLRFEDLLDDPEPVLRRLLTYLLRTDDVDAGFLARAATLVRRPASRWQDLEARDRGRLEAACQAGFAALAARGYTWR
jgi:putative sulfotransferase